ncbi:hypothetical protein HYC85_030052 [Camellia sinensis]|uniref:Uncharacterized protein n=1 Tax=Camellia sinensis TaxID=4442 RepID=A0A7J7G110_CAMSI|nr:hypothetical protein HYC85_030052 [Camellia sinensis]
MVATMVDESRVALLEDGNVSSVPEGSVDLSEEEYNPCHYIVPTNHAKPELELPTGMEVSAVREDGPSQGLDDLTDLEEDINNL